MSKLEQSKVGAVSETLYTGAVRRRELILIYWTSWVRQRHWTLAVLAGCSWRCRSHLLMSRLHEHHQQTDCDDQQVRHHSAATQRSPSISRHGGVRLLPGTPNSLTHAAQVSWHEKNTFISLIRTEMNFTWPFNTPRYELATLLLGVRRHTGLAHGSEPHYSMLPFWQLCSLKGSKLSGNTGSASLCTENELDLFSRFDFDKTSTYEGRTDPHRAIPFM